MSKRRCCGKEAVAAVAEVGCGNQFGSLCSNPICALIILIILQKTCLLENNNAFLLILLFLGFCFCRGGRVGCGRGFGC
ncbi:hypothetical protein [Clostridium sp. FP1]|uniref:hypothetical protein n=1 Tax=Clostridium sp. FP1 TaxID=2724076 RepID=UPI0013E93A36|nr:hypothetical protein [Clostridium sp. FP1]MBZ9636701.1 hypothetical protein [Clostridium sp. FP1]